MYETIYQMAMFIAGYSGQSAEDILEVYSDSQIEEIYTRLLEDEGL